MIHSRNIPTTWTSTFFFAHLCTCLSTQAHTRGRRHSCARRPHRLTWWNSPHWDQMEESDIWPHAAPQLILHLTSMRRWNVIMSGDWQGDRVINRLYGIVFWGGMSVKPIHPFPLSILILDMGKHTFQKHACSVRWRPEIILRWMLECEQFV